METLTILKVHATGLTMLICHFPFRRDYATSFSGISFGPVVVLHVTGPCVGCSSVESCDEDVVGGCATEELEGTSNFAHFLPNPMLLCGPIALWPKYLVGYNLRI